MSDLLTIEEAAVIARCDGRVIRRAIHDHQLKASFTARWLVEERDLLDWMRRRGEQRAGRKPRVKRRRRSAKPRDERVGSVHELRAIEAQGDTA